MENRNIEEVIYDYIGISKCDMKFHEACNYRLNIGDAMEIAKIYAKEVAEQALKDAVHAHLGIWDYKDEDVYYSAKESILNTPIVTP